MKKSATIVLTVVFSICIFSLNACILGGDIAQYKYIGETKVRMTEIDPGGVKVFDYNNGPELTAFDPYVIFYDTHYVVAQGTKGIDYKPYFVVIELPTKEGANCVVHESYSSDEYEQIIKEKNIELDKMEQTDAHIPWRLFQFLKEKE